MQEKVINNLEQDASNIEEVIIESSFFEKVSTLLTDPLFTSHGEVKTPVTLGYILLIILAIVLTTFFLRLVKKIVTRKILKEDKDKFNTIFSFTRWVIYLVMFLVVLSTLGYNVTGILVASSGLLIGVGLALQVLFQDIISGVFILIDKTVHVGDIIELDGKVGRVIEIKLRTTRAVTIDNKVLIIPNHLYLTNSLYNWTQNGSSTRETVDVGVAYGSDVELVEKLLLEAAASSDLVFVNPPPTVIFKNFGESSLDFRVAFTIQDSFNVRIPKSEVRFAIYKLFKEHNITIPFPQRDIHIKNEEDNMVLKMKAE